MKRIIFALTAACLASLPLAAQDSTTVNEEDFFGGDGAAVEVEGTTTEAYAENFIKEEPVRFGGSFNLSAKTGIDYYLPWNEWDQGYFLTDKAESSVDEPAADKRENSGIDLGGSLYFTARPSESLRFFGKAKFAFPFSYLAASPSAYNDLLDVLKMPETTIPEQIEKAYAMQSLQEDSGVSVPNIKIWELYSDFDIGNAVFLRAGKQMVKWSAGSYYQFFSPADIISLTPIDVNDRTADREGPLAVKANVPFGNNNLDLYAIAPSDSDLTSVSQLGVAARQQIVLGGWELGLGTGWQEDRDIQFVATASGSVDRFGVFGEALVNRRANGIYLEKDSKDDSGYKVVDVRRDWFFSGTVGASYDNTDLYFNAFAQYYYNGMGYDRMDAVSKAAVAHLASGDLTVVDIFAMAAGFTGKHYVALSLSESFVKDSKVSVGTVLIANLSDYSGTVKPSVTIKITDEIRLSVDTSVSYGGDNTQFRGISKAVLGSDVQAIADMADTFRMPQFSMGISLDLGSGNF